MKVLVTGSSGQLGFDVVRELSRRGIECIGTTRDDFDLTGEASTRAFFHTCHPDAVIHCAAYTAVDRAEDEAELCYAVNETGTRNIAKACREISAKLLYISTDYVFPGTGASFYEIDAATGPLNVYGRSKLAGEQAIKELLTHYFIVRISWVFGAHGNNFVAAMRRLAASHDELRVVGDQIGAPTYTADLAALLADMIATESYGVYHATNEGSCSWAEFAREIFRLTGANVAVQSIPTSAYPTKATRPRNSRMSKASLDAAGFQRLPHWRNALQRYLWEFLDK